MFSICSHESRKMHARYRVEYINACKISREYINACKISREYINAYKISCKIQIDSRSPEDSHSAKIKWLERQLKFHGQGATSFSGVK
jgi:hypothetical protein